MLGSILSLLFVIDLMLKAGPEIHRDSTDLYLYFYINHTVRQENRHLYQHVIGFVTAGLGGFEIILNSQFF